MAAGMRFKSFHEAVTEANDLVKGQTTIKVISFLGEEEVEKVFVDQNTGDFIMVCKGVNDPEPEDRTGPVKKVKQPAGV